MSDDAKRTRLYSPSRRGYMRATVEEGIRAELDAMNAEARGTPFFGAASSHESPSSASGDLAARLAALTRRPR